MNSFKFKKKGMRILSMYYSKNLHTTIALINEIKEYFKLLVNEEF